MLCGALKYMVRGCIFSIEYDDVDNDGAVGFGLTNSYDYQIAVLPNNGDGFVGTFPTSPVAAVLVAAGV